MTVQILVMTSDPDGCRARSKAIATASLLFVPNFIISYAKYDYNYALINALLAPKSPDSHNLYYVYSY